MQALIDQQRIQLTLYFLNKQNRKRWCIFKLQLAVIFPRRN